MEARHHGWFGILLVTASALAFSTAGFFTRLIELDVWTILFWRGLFGGAFIAAFIVAQHRRRSLDVVRAIGVPGLVVTVCSAVATVCFVNALRLTTVADVAVIYAVAPFTAAAIAWVCSGERERRATLVASLVALAGVCVMFQGAASFDHVAGDLLALAMTLLMSVVMVIIRSCRSVSMLPASGLSAFLSSMLVAPLASPDAVTALDLAHLLLFGVTQFGLGLLLLTLGTRLLSASRAALIGNLELPLGPIWVWLAFAEVPPQATVVGGVIVLAAVLADMLAGQPRPRVAASVRPDDTEPLPPAAPCAPAHRPGLFLAAGKQQQVAVWIPDDERACAPRLLP